MTALDRAKRFVAHHAAATALVIVPLAVASPASASVILADGTASRSGAGDGPAGTSTFVPVANGGIKFFGNPGYNVDASGGTFQFGLRLEGTGTGTLDMSTIAAHYDFTLSSQVLPITEFTWSIDYLINGWSRGSATASGSTATISASGDLTLSGWDPGEALESWGVALVLAGKFTPVAQRDELFTLDVPNHSISLTPGPSTSVPEPALLLLVGAALVVASRRRSR